MTYTELVAAIESYTENQFPATYLADGSTVSTTTQINLLIKQAEQRIYNSVQFPSIRKNVTGALTIGNKYLSCPADFLSTYSLAIYSSASTSATGSSGAFTIVVSSATNIEVGQAVYGTNIGTGAVVASINGTTITLDVANSGAVNSTITFQGDYLYLLNKDVNFIREVYPNPRNTAKPKYYAIFGPQSNDVNELSLIVGPTPDIASAAELPYY